MAALAIFSNLEKYDVSNGYPLALFVYQIDNKRNERISDNINMATHNHSK